MRQWIFTARVACWGIFPLLAAYSILSDLGLLPFVLAEGSQIAIAAVCLILQVDFWVRLPRILRISGPAAEPAEEADDQAAKDRKAVSNARFQLLATLLNIMANATFTVGVAAPLAATFFVSNAPPVHVIEIGVILWAGAALLLHVMAQLFVLGRIRA